MFWTTVIVAMKIAFKLQCQHTINITTIMITMILTTIIRDLWKTTSKMSRSAPNLFLYSVIFILCTEAVCDRSLQYVAHCHRYNFMSTNWFHSFYGRRCYVVILNQSNLWLQQWWCWGWKMWWYPPCEWSCLFTEMAGYSHIIGKVIADLSWKHIWFEKLSLHIWFENYINVNALCDYAKYEFMTVLLIMTTKIMTVFMNPDCQNHFHNHDHQNYPSPLFIHFHCSWCPILNIYIYI